MELLNGEKMAAKQCLRKALEVFSGAQEKLDRTNEEYRLFSCSDEKAYDRVNVVQKVVKDIERVLECQRTAFGKNVRQEEERCTASLASRTAELQHLLQNVGGVSGVGGFEGAGPRVKSKLEVQAKGRRKIPFSKLCVRKFKSDRRLLICTGMDGHESHWFWSTQSNKVEFLNLASSWLEVSEDQNTDMSDLIAGPISLV